MDRKKILNLFLLVFWLLIIFYFSNQPGNSSSYLSDNLTLLIFNDISNLLIFIVRKIAHISEFFILTLLIYNVLKDYVDFKKSCLFSFVFSVLYSISDELHQLFVVGRECLLRDVFIDAIGIILALIIIFFIKQYKSKRRIKY